MESKLISSQGTVYAVQIISLHLNWWQDWVASQKGTPSTRWEARLAGENTVTAVVLVKLSKIMRQLAC